MKDYFPFITFNNIYLIKNIINIYINKFLNISDLIHDFNDKRNEIIIFNNHSIKNLIIHAKI